MFAPITSVEGVFLWMLVHHTIGDFMLQADEDAIKKYFSNKHLFSHVLSYIIWWWVNIFVFANWWLVMAFAGITFVCHFITDYFTSRAIHRYFSNNRIRMGFIVIGWDQASHIIQLWFTYKFLLSIQNIYI